MLMNTLLSDNKGMRSLYQYAAQINNTNENQFEEQTSTHNTSEANNINNIISSLKSKETTSARKSLSVNNRERESLERSTLESSVVSAPNNLLQLPELTPKEESEQEEEESSSLSSQDSSLQEQKQEEEEETESELAESEREEEVESSLSPPAQMHSSSNELSLSETSSSSLSSSSSPSLSQTLLSRLFTSPRIAHQRMQKRKIELQSNNSNTINENNTKVYKGKEEISKNDHPEHIFSLKSKWYPNEREFSELFASVQQCNGLLCLK